MSDEQYVSGAVYLTVQAINKGSRKYPRWQFGGVNVRKSKPDTAADEVAMKLSIRLPVALFEKPLLAASIDIDGDMPALSLSSQTVGTIQDLIRAQTGLDVELTLVTNDGD